MSEYSQGSYRGILVPEQRLNDLDVSSTYSQAGPEVGIPQPQSDTDLNLKSSGTQSANKKLRITTQEGGFGGDGRASYRWKNETDSATSWRGWNAPSALSSWRAIQWITGAAGSITATQSACSVTLPDQTVLIAYHAQTNFIGQPHRIIISKLTSAGVHTSSTVYFTPKTLVQGLHPALLRLPNGRLLLFHYIEDQTSNLESIQVAIKVSDDNGATWSPFTDAALDEAINVQTISTSGFHLNQWPSRGMRVAYSNGQIILIIGARSNNTGAWRDYFMHYASDDLGSHFALVENWGTTAGTKGCRANIIARDSGFEVFYVRDANTIERKSIGDAFSSIIDSPSTPLTYRGGVVPIASASATLFTDAELAVVETDSGEGYLCVRYQWGANFDRIGMSYARWGFRGLAAGALMGQSAVATAASAGLWGTVWNGAGSGDYPRDLFLASQNGRVLMLHNWVATIGNEDDSLGCAYLGGYSSVTLPAFSTDNSQASRMTWEITYLPIERPNHGLGWTLAGVGTADLIAGALNLDTTVQTLTYNQTPAGTIEGGLVVSFGVQYVSDVLGAEDIYVDLAVGDASSRHRIKIAILPTSVKVIDTVSAATLANITAPTATGVEVLAFINVSDTGVGKGSVFVRPLDYAADSVWTTIINGSTLTDGGLQNTSIKWGHDQGSSVSNWFWFNYSSGIYACRADAGTGFTNPTDLHGRAYGSREPTYVSDGAAIQSIDGPSTKGDSWNIDTRYKYQVKNILPSIEPSPSMGWRSTDEAAQILIWDIKGPIAQPTLGLVLEGVNWRTGTLSGWNSSTSAWDTIAAIDTATGQTAVPLTLRGDTYFLNKAAGAFSGRFVDSNELTNGTLDLAGTKRKIASNNSGTLNNSISSKGLGIRFDGLTGAEPATATTAIWSPRIVIVAHNKSLVYTKFRLLIAATQGTTEGYYKIGTMALGPIHVFANDYSYGRIQEVSSNTEMTTYRDGRRSSLSRGKSRRSVRFAWVDGVDETSIEGASPTPDNVVTTSTVGALSVSYRGDTPRELASLERDLEGPNKPIVYLPSFAKGPPDTVHIQGWEKSLYGRLLGPITRDNLVGEENSNIAGEVIKVSTIAIDEEI